MKCFRVDESGYTGFDLLNKAQPFQGATALEIDDADAARLIKEYFPRLQAPELKYRALSRRPNNHPQLLALIRDILSGYQSITYVCDKKFLLILMFCDYAIEPWYHRRGVNFYKDGQNYAMASLLATAGPTILGKPEFEALLMAFQHAVRVKDAQSLGALVFAARQTNWKELPEAIGPIAQFEAPECLSEISQPGVSTDAAMVVLQSLISRMEVMSEGPYRVEHDQSENLKTYHDLIQRFIQHDDKIEFRQSEIASLKFPLKLVEVQQVDSKCSPAVQLSDVMIGAAIEAARTMTGQFEGGLDPEVLLPLYRDNQIIHLLPDTDFDEQRRFRQGTQANEVIDYFAEHFFDS